MFSLKKLKFTSLWTILALAALARVIYWLQIHEEAWFLSPGADPEFYRAWASDILAGRGDAYLPFPRAPLYSYLLAGLTKFLGDGWLPPRLWNLAAELVSICFVYLMGQRISGKSTGLIAALIWAFCGSAVYFSGEILMTSTVLMLTTVWLFYMLEAAERPASRNSLISGATLGLLCLLRPNFLIFLPVDLALLGWAAWRFSPPAGSVLPLSPPACRGGLKGGYPLLLHLLIALVLISPVTIANYRAAGRLIPISTQGGVNVFIGNASGANGWSSTLPGVGAAWTEADARRVASASAGRALNNAEASEEFIRMSRAEITADFPGWLKLMARKALMLVNLRDIGNNRPLELAWLASGLLSLLRFLTVGFWLPLALAGMVCAWRRQTTRLLTGYSLIFAASLLMFFITARYRLPLLPAVSVLAAAGVTGLYQNRRTVLQWKSATMALVLAAVLAFPSWGVMPGENRVQAEFMAGNASLRLNRLAEGLRHFRAAYAADSTFPDLNLNIGALEMRAGDTTAAETAFRRELAVHPDNPRALNNLGVIAERRGNFELAQQRYAEASRINPESMDFRVNLWRSCMMRGDAFLERGEWDSARALYDNATVLQIRDARPWHRLAEIAVRRNRGREAVELCRRALAVNPDYSPAQALLTALEGGSD